MNLKKLFVIAITPIIALTMTATILPVKDANAANNSNSNTTKPATPTLAVKTQRKNNILIGISDAELKSTFVRVELKIREESAGTERIAYYRMRLNPNGERNILVRRLKPNTQYTFSARIRKASDKTFSDYSSTISGRTVQ